MFDCCAYTSLEHLGLNLKFFEYYSDLTKHFRLAIDYGVT